MYSKYMSHETQLLQKDHSVCYVCCTVVWKGNPTWKGLQWM